MIRTATVGNYPRIGDSPETQKHRRGIANMDKGEITKEEFLRIEREVTKEVIELQTKAGIEVITDGHIRWEDSFTYWARKINGFIISGLLRYFDTNTYYRQPVVSGALAWSGPISIDDYLYAKSVSPVPVKAVITGPFTFASLSRDDYYRSKEKVVLALAEVLNQEILSLEKAGASLVQVNEPWITWEKDGITLLNKGFIRLVQNVKIPVLLHTSFGDLEGIYPKIQDLPFYQLGLDCIMGPKNVELLRKNPPKKPVALGLIDARNTKMENPEEIISILQEFIPKVPELLELSPNTGLEFLPREIAQDKLVHLSKIATRAKEVLVR